MADNLEKRLDALEREVAKIKRRLPSAGVEHNWVDEFAGSMKEFPEFDEVIRLGRQFREAQTDTAD
jgi:hypothetical protein